MVWQVGVLDVANRPLAGNVTVWNHANHGQLTITRGPKLAGAATVNYTLALAPVAGPVPNNVIVHSTHVHGDQDARPAAALGAARGGGGNANHPITFGYGDIDLQHLVGIGIIYPVHHAMAVTAAALGCRYFVVGTIVNPALDHVCQQCGMGPGFLPGARQGTADRVTAASLAVANARGWQ